MNYPNMLALAGLVAIGFTFTASADEKRAVEADKHSGMHMECAKACNDCQRECDDCVLHCTEMLVAGKKEHARILGTCNDCANLCSVAAQIVARQGPMSMTICDACAKACNTCAATCEKFPDDEQMKRCALECRKCEKACREMLKHVEFGTTSDGK